MNDFLKLFATVECSKLEQLYRVLIHKKLMDEIKFTESYNLVINLVRIKEKYINLILLDGKWK